MRILLSLSALVFGVVILFLSLIRSGWETATITIDGDRLRTEPIFFEVRNDDGGVEKRLYKIPNTLVLPKNPSYVLKTWRDWLWYLMAKSPKDKSEMARLIADKRMGEAIKMSKGAGKTAEEAVEWLVLANNWLERPSPQIFQASLAYKYEIEIIKATGEIDSVKYLELIKKLEGIK